MAEPRKSSKLRGLDAVAFLLAVVVAAALIFALDTGPLVIFVDRHRASKLDESIVVGILLLLGLIVFLAARSFGLAKRIRRASHDPTTSFSDRARARLHHDMIGIALAMLAAIALVFLFDTGKLAAWVARQKDTKIDEVIVVSIVFLLGLCFLAVRRWLELTDYLVEYEEINERVLRLNRESRILRELTDMLQSCLTFEEAHQVISTSAQALLPESSGALCVAASSRNMVEVVATWGAPSVLDGVFKPQDCWALRRGKIHLSDDSAGTLHCAHLGARLPAGSLCVPMMAHGESLGLLYIDTGGNALPLAEIKSFADWERLARVLAEQTSLALANLKLREVLRIQSVRDPLTNLYNRRYMEESFDREVSRAARRQSPLGVIMIDIDHFKRFNDTFGHEAGDAVLRSFAAMLLQKVRSEDIVCRYGGEEFTIILPDLPPGACTARAEQIREAACALVTELRGQKLDRITISVGVAAFP